MTQATHIVRFIASEDNKIHLGQLVDTSRDVGLDTRHGKSVKAYLINGTIFHPLVTKHVYTIKHLLSPVSVEDCNFIRCLGLNYSDHAKEANLALPSAPILFAKPRTALASPFPEAITIPKCAQDGTSDYEAELCVVVGKSGRDIPEEDALSYVLGYTCSNDVSARNLQLATPQWSFSKGLDSSCPIGPVLVTTSVISEPQSLDIKCTYNDNLVQNGNTRDMIFNIKKQIAYLSQGTTLEAGTLILTGTPAGIGFLRKPRVVLEDGGEVSVFIDGIGTLVNQIKYEAS